MPKLQYWIQKNQIPFQTIELSNSDKEMVQYIITKRSRFLWSLFFGFIIAPLFVMIMCTRPDYNMVKNFIKSDWKIFCVLYGTYLFFVLIIMLCLYFKRIKPYVKDLKHGTKMQLLSQIMNKQHFPVTDTYYLITNLYPYNQREVTVEEFNHYQIGAIFPIEILAYSKYIFNNSEKFTIV